MFIFRTVIIIHCDPSDLAPFVSCFNAIANLLGQLFEVGRSGPQFMQTRLRKVFSSKKNMGETDCCQMLSSSSSRDYLPGINLGASCCRILAWWCWLEFRFCRDFGWWWLRSYAQRWSAWQATPWNTSLDACSKSSAAWQKSPMKAKEEQDLDLHYRKFNVCALSISVLNEVSNRQTANPVQP